MKNEKTACEICQTLVDTPDLVSMNFQSAGGKEVRFLICSGCTIMLVNHIKKIAKAAGAVL
jgi:hypothetical protein